MPLSLLTSGIGASNNASPRSASSSTNSTRSDVLVEQTLLAFFACPVSCQSIN